MTEDSTPATIDNVSKFEQYRRQSQESIKLLWDYDLNFAQNVQKLIGSFTLLPNASIQLPVITSLILAPTPLCDKLPIAFCIGGAGSGKSTIAMVASEIHNCPILNASSSPASIRNEAMRLRFTEDNEEKIYLLIWDDIKASSLLDYPVTYSIFRGGYDRKTDTVTVAAQDGINQVYRVFGGRLVSSIEPVFNHPKMTELQRRTLPIVCKKFTNFNREEALEAGISNEDWQIGDKPDPSDYDWRELNKEMIRFWNDDDRLLSFAQSKSKLNKSKRLKDKLGGFLTIARDLVATSVACELFPDLETAVSAYARYWEEIARPCFSDLSAMATVIEYYIAELTRPIAEMNTKAGYEVMPLTVSPSALKTHLELAAKNGELDTYATPKEIATTMRQLGWELVQLVPPSPVTGMQWIKQSK
jgi:hypothetical protein